MPELAVHVQHQPDDYTCGPTCLEAIYRYYDRALPLEQVIAEIPQLPMGGTLAVSLANHALRRGFSARIYTYNLQLFDPTWLDEGGGHDLAKKLRAQLGVKEGPRLREATEAYLEYLELGGEVVYRDLDADLLFDHFEHGRPLLTGLSSTYLYRSAREHEDDYDDVRGHPMGHFVVLSGGDREKRRAQVADPLHDNPGFGSGSYTVSVERLIGAIFLGVMTYDANLLVLTPSGG